MGEASLGDSRREGVLDLVEMLTAMDRAHQRAGEHGKDRLHHQCWQAPSLAVHCLGSGHDLMLAWTGQSCPTRGHAVIDAMD